MLIDGLRNQAVRYRASSFAPPVANTVPMSGRIFSNDECGFHIEFHDDSLAFCHEPSTVANVAALINPLGSARLGLLGLDI